MSTNRLTTTVYKLTNMDKARFRRAARRYAPMMPLAAAYWLLMLEAYTVRDGDMVLLKPPGLRPSFEQFASCVGHDFHMEESRPTPAPPQRKYPVDGLPHFTAEDLISDADRLLELGRT